LIIRKAKEIIEFIYLFFCKPLVRVCRLRIVRFKHRILSQPEEIFNFTFLYELSINETLFKIFQNVNGIFFHEDSMSFDDRLDRKVKIVCYFK